MAKTKRKKRAAIGTLLIALGATVILASGILWFVLRAEDRHAAEAAAEVLLEMDARTSAEDEEPAEAEETGRRAPRPVYRLSERTEYIETLMDIGGRDYLGNLSFTGYERRLPVLADWSMERLTVAPARYTGSVETDNIIIGAHNYQAHFSILNRMVEGNEIVFTDAVGNEIHYLVRSIETLDSTDLDLLLSGSWDMTLFTCTYEGNARRVLRCERMTHAYGLD